MTITSLRITDFRNLAEVEIDPCQQGLNIICGNNGSGKTSLLEAIHYLGLGRSFRSSNASRLIRHDQNKFSLFAQLLIDQQRHVPVGVERDHAGTMRLRAEEKELSSITELAAYLPTRVINSHSHHIFESGPIYRRKYLDWGLFYQFENFLLAWRLFERSLKQRNAALRITRTKKEIEAWTDELIKHGSELDRLRQEYVQMLRPQIGQVAATLLDIPNLDIQYLSGWQNGVEYSNALAASLEDDIRFGHTQNGPHRADLDVTIEGVPVKHILSRGQQKLLICAMIISQGLLLDKHLNKGLIYLIDDLPSELDIQSKRKLISLLAEQNTQVFITSIESAAICDFINGELKVPLKVFHVEHGQIGSN